ncbi:MAG TPA: VanZ family protein [Patescibacteria group bacterium]|nr:VanZ family protein [Patescibacteria group bacterium]
MFQKENGSKIFNWTLAIVWMALIFWSSSVSDFGLGGGESGQGSDVYSSIAHVVLYAVLTGLLIRALMSSGYKLTVAFFGGFIIAILYGISDEVHQSFVPGRESHISDWLFDLIGSYLVLSAYTYKYRRNKKLRK